MKDSAVLAKIDGSLIKKGAFCSHQKTYKMCTRCVMDTTDPEIFFDEHGICNHCKKFDDEILSNWNVKNEDDKNEFDSILKIIKKRGRDKPYDCIIGVSGGVDSSFLVIKAVEWGLRPLLFHVDGGWNSELAVSNIEQLCKRLNIDLYTHVIDWDEMRDLQLAYLKSNLANQDVPQDHAFFAGLYHFAFKKGIKTIFTGSNYATESTLPQAWGYNAMDAKQLKYIGRKYGSKRLLNFPIINFFRLYIFYPRIFGLKTFKPLNYIHYNKDEAKEILISDYGWSDYGGKHSESIWTKFFQNYYLPHKFGYDKRKAHLSSMILSETISREEALIELDKTLYEKNEVLQDMTFISKKLGISIDEFSNLIKQPLNHYSSFPNNEKLVLLLMNIAAYLKKIILLK